MSNVVYEISGDGFTAKGKLPGGTVFLIDADILPVVRDISFCLCRKGPKYSVQYLMDSDGKVLHDHLFPHKAGLEVDHINLNTMDNRRINIRYCTHQQNQINQPLQKNNTSGVSGVSFYPSRNKYRARIKIGQHEIHLGYYLTFIEAVQARNVGMECMFGEYARYNDVPNAPEKIRKSVIEKCKRFAELSICEAFLASCREVA